MFREVIVVFFGLVGALNGVPLERASADLSQYFAPRIIGGVDAPDGHAPHIVALVGGSFFITVGCGGSIVSKKHVLTAAHCITFYVVDGTIARNFHGRVGSNEWQSGGTRIEFTSYSIHPKYDPDSIKYDVGFFMPSEELKLNERVAVIALNYNHIGSGHESYVTGWGTIAPIINSTIVDLAPTPDFLQLIYLLTIDGIQCEKDLQAMTSIIQWMPTVNPEVEICTFHSIGHGTCNGDSGSGLVSVKYGNLIGVVSWGLPCARGAPDIFVRISGPAIISYLKSVLNK